MRTARGTLRTLAVLCAMVGGVPRVSAQPEGAARPWATGIADSDQARANKLFARGNELLEQGAFALALDQYRQVIAIWDHPAVRYNAAVALINLERTIEAYQELERALRFGADALEPDIYEQALAYQRLLRAQIVPLTVECVDADTRISLDGAELAVPCPGALPKLITPGRHRLIAAKQGYLTRTVDLTPSGGESLHERIDLKTLEEATIQRHRRGWASWKPWAVVGAGAAIGLVGLGFELQSAATFRSYDRAIAVLCPDHPCTELPGVVTDAYATARRENQVAIGAFVGGGAVLVTGVVLLWLNREVSERLGYDNTPVPIASFGSHGSTIGAVVAF